MSVRFRSLIAGIILCVLLLQISAAFQVQDVSSASDPAFSDSITSLSDAEPHFSPQQILVRFNTPETGSPSHAIASADQITALHASIRAQQVYASSPQFLPGLQLVQIPESMTVQDAITWYQNQPSVLYAEPDYQVFLDKNPTAGNQPPEAVNISRVPSDPLYPLQWNLNNTGQYRGTPGADIHAEGAWDVTTGSDVIVAVVDSGVDYLHPDLKENIWTDPVTGLHGYNFYGNNTDVIHGL